MKIKISSDKIIFSVATKMNPNSTVDQDNGMIICGCGIEGELDGYCPDCLPLSSWEDNTPLSVLKAKKARSQKQQDANQISQQRRLTSTKVCEECPRKVKNQYDKCFICFLKSKK